jgi:hypothetical protein
LYCSVLYAMFSTQVLRIRRITWLPDFPIYPGDNRPRFTSGVLHSSQCDPHVRPPVCCVKYGSSDPLCRAQYDCTQRFHAANIQKTAIGGLRTKNYSDDAFPEVLRVTFLRAATATPIPRRRRDGLFRLS